MLIYSFLLFLSYRCYRLACIYLNWRSITSCHDAAFARDCALCYCDDMTILIRVQRPVSVSGNSFIIQRIWTRFYTADTSLQRRFVALYRAAFRDWPLSIQYRFL